MPQLMRTTCLLAFICLWGLPCEPQAAVGEARVLSVSPSVISMHQGRSETLAPRMRIPVSATVASDANGRAQLMFADTTTISIAPATEIALAEFVDDPNGESIVLDLARGTARFITGEVSRRRPSAMMVNTPQANVGIRGTMVTIAVRGDTTMVYLTETSGLGVTVTERRTGKSLTMRRPGRMITVTPRGLEERAGTLDEVRKMAGELHSRPPLANGLGRRPEELPNISPAGMHGAEAVMDSSLERAAALPIITPSPVAPASPSPDMLPEPDVSQYAGTFMSPDKGYSLTFSVDTKGGISGAHATVPGNLQGATPFSGSQAGPASVGPGGGFSINYSQDRNSLPFESMTTNGGFSNANGGSYVNSVTEIDPAGMRSTITTPRETFARTGP